MNKLKRAIVVLGLIGLLVAACIPSKQQINEILTAAEQITFVPVTYTPDVNVIVAQTFAAMTAQAGGQPVPPTATTNAPGSISGTLSYPSEGIPPLRVVAYNLFDQSYRYVDTQQDQNTYQITSLAPGKYHVVAYVAGGGLAGGYTPAVACGLMVTCTDHALLEVMVFSGQDTPNINPHDWYAPEGTFPPMPQMGAILPTPTQDGPPGLSGNGSLGGKIGYPSSGIPAMAIVAFKVGNMNEYYSITTAQNQSSYQMSLPPGQYYVVAYVLGGGLAGGYTLAVLCGLTVNCTDHSLIAVQVSSMVVLNSEVNLMDWYAPDGSFPAYPLP
jgi:hypothetical protein